MEIWKIFINQEKKLFYDYVISIMIKLFNDYAKIRSKAKYRTEQRTGLKIVTPKQMLQRLPIAFAQVTAGNNSESLLNETRQIVYALYPSKEITKKLYNNIIKSLQI